MNQRIATKSGDRRRRSEVVTVRLDPQLKYLAELAARRQRRPLSSYIEWAVERSLGQVYPASGSTSHEAQTFADVASELWDVDEPDRFVRLALAYPDLLDYEEQRLWKLIRDNGVLWRCRLLPDNRWEWTVDEDSIIWERLRQHWGTICGVARGALASSKLPTLETHAPVLASDPESDPDDEVPY